MNYYEPTELTDKEGKGIGKYHYTRFNDNQKVTHPVGYCGRSILATAKIVEEDDTLFLVNDSGFKIPTSQENIDKHKKFKDKHHHPEGHNTPEEACECYKEYQMDNNLSFVKVELGNADTHRKCEVERCNIMTASYAMINSIQRWDICIGHLNKEEVEKLYKVVNSFGSC